MTVITDKHSETVLRRLRLHAALSALGNTAGPRQFSKTWLLSTAMRRRVLEQDEYPKLLGV